MALVYEVRGRENAGHRERLITLTVDVLYEANVLKPLGPLHKLPEYTKVRLTIEALPCTATPARVITMQYQPPIILSPFVAPLCHHTDIIMPEPEGLGVIKTLRRCAPDIKMTAISGGSPGLPEDY